MRGNSNLETSNIEKFAIKHRHVIIRNIFCPTNNEINCSKRTHRWICNRWLGIDNNRRNEDTCDDVVRRMWKDCETLAFSSPERMKRRSLRIFRHSIAKGINFSERECVRERRLYNENLRQRMRRMRKRARSRWFRRLRKRTGALNGRGRIRSRKRRGGRERRRELRKPLSVKIRPIVILRARSRTNGFSPRYFLSSVVAPLGEKLHRPFKDFMTNLFNDRGLKLPAKVRVFVISRLLYNE